MSAYNFDIEHRVGVKRGNSDGMSRRPCPDEGKTCKKEKSSSLEMLKEKQLLQRKFFHVAGDVREETRASKYTDTGIQDDFRMIGKVYYKNLGRR